MIENPNANAQAIIDQISSLIVRYNQLAEEVKVLETEEEKKDTTVKQLKSQMEGDMAELKINIEEIKQLIGRATKYKMNVGSDFKQIIKQDLFNRLSKRIDSLNLENNISREELYRLLDRIE